jgi:hypothetical protein
MGVVGELGVGVVREGHGAIVYAVAVASWNALEREAPEVAEGGRATLFRTDAGDCLLATVRGPGLPRINPVNVGVVEGRLLVFVQPWSAKARDLEADGRFAVHAIIDPEEPHEFAVRGHARPVTDADLRAQAAAAWPFEPGPEYLLYELDIAHALFGWRASPDDWPPAYTSWRAPAE